MSTFTYVGSELRLFEAARNWKRYWQSQFLPYVRGRVLEVGAGIGTNTRLFDGSKYERWVCLEPDAALASKLGENICTMHGVDVITGTVADLAEADRFDAVLYIDVLEHIENDRDELARAALHLQADGHLMVLVPAHQWLHTPFDRAIGHFRRYSRWSLRSIVPRELSPIAVRYVDAAGMLASLANRLLLRQSMPTASQIAFWDRRLVPVSRVLDPLFRYAIGKSVLAVWRRTR